MTMLDKPVRRIVTIDDADGSSIALCDRTLARRPHAIRHGPAMRRAASGSPAVNSPRIDDVDEALLSRTPSSRRRNGSVCRVVTFPPDAVYAGKVGASEVQPFLPPMGSPGASTYSPKAPHPYMQKTRTLDFCLVLEGRITLVLDTRKCIWKPATP